MKRQFKWASRSRRFETSLCLLLQGATEDCRFGINVAGEDRALPGRLGGEVELQKNEIYNSKSSRPS